MRSEDIQATLECNGIRRTQSVQITQTKMQLLLAVFAKDALSVVHINTPQISTILCPTHLTTQISSSSLTHLHTTVLVTAAMYTLICSLITHQDKCTPCSTKLVSELTSNMSELFYAHPDWKPNGSVIDRKINVDVEAGYQSAEFENSAILLVIG